MADYTGMMFHSCSGIYLARNFLIGFSGVANPDSLSIEWVNEYGNPYNTTELINIYKDRIESKINATFPNIYTKTEVDQKIAEAGGGGTTDYNALTNKPIDNYVLQNNLDCGAHDLTKLTIMFYKTI